MDPKKFKEITKTYKNRYTHTNPSNLANEANLLYEREEYTKCFDKLSELSQFRQNQDSRLMNNIACLLGRSFAQNFSKKSFDLNRSSALAWAKHFEDLCNWLLKGYTCEVAQLFFTPTEDQKKETILKNLNIFYNRGLLLSFGGEMESTYQLFSQLLEILDLNKFELYQSGPELIWLFREIVITLGYSHLLDECTQLILIWLKQDKKSNSKWVSQWLNGFIIEKFGSVELAINYLKFREQNFMGLTICPNPNFQNSINKSLIGLEKFFNLITLDPTNKTNSLSNCLSKPLIQHLQVIYYNNKGCLELLNKKPFQAGFYFILANNTHFSFLDNNLTTSIYPSLNYEIDYNHSIASLMSKRYREPRSVYLSHINSNTIWRCDPYLWLRLGETTRLLDSEFNTRVKIKRLREALNFFITGRTFIERSLVFRKEALSLIPTFEKLISETCELLDSAMRGGQFAGDPNAVEAYGYDSELDDDEEDEREAYGMGRGDMDEDGRVIVVNEKGEITEGENMLDGDDPRVIKVIINPSGSKK
ncbi:hypothetical protein CONCODRAFT_17158 [Conidiobolus coronatus NRRL 28638]|uniref:Uncharacterized protein n=1 Tax=Conidiobolus coronatus (strain ATCC 28846 / CBS 209.66 / NRRL 28638) TaxID=796925 RepID=A0A137P800_CONC2|nr:hypothetical protein CONCODRAFT_17158 [Conidiobolus coronatus NRRL 28638]|eukprot:KXN71051.1 hypothetical protein CONCODRAFT_17158 [Conidiobolus coronatus NRRL 28638]